MQTAKERGQEVRHRLLTAAAEVIAERGWTAATTRVVAERAGVAPGLVHYHFASVQALLIAAVLRQARELTGQLTPLLARATDAGDTVTLLLAALDSYDGTDPVSVLLIEAYLAATRDQQLRQALAAEIIALRDEVAGHLAAHGVADPAATAAVLLAALDGVLLHRSLLGAGDAAPVLRRLVTRCE